MTGRDGPIGGFIGLETPGPRGETGFDAGARLMFRNARAGLAHLLRLLRPPRVWLPAYVCAEVAEAARLPGRPVLYYGVGGDLTPRAEALERDLKAGDAVVGIDYFGAPAALLPDLAARRRDVVWIQDRAQGLWPAPLPWGDFLLYSPRKVVGVPDGGVLISRQGALAEPLWEDDDGGEAPAAALARFEDPDGRRSEAWYALYRRAEAAMTTRPLRPSRLTQGLLPALDIQTAGGRRHENAEMLLAGLAGRALFGTDRLLSGAPLGVPVLVEDAGEVAKRMAAEQVFCARHWAALPSPAAEFEAEHRLARRVLTLPCDQRYDRRAMERVLDAFARACAA